jgi:hypothetical protein
MKLVKVRTQELLAKVRANRDTHVTDYEESIVGWRAERAEVAAKVAKLAKKAIDDHSTEVVVYQLSSLQKPQSHVKDYDRVIGMLEMSVEEELEITAQEFSQYVQDEWSWREAFAASTANYKGKGG